MTMFDLQHIPNTKDAKRLIPGFIPKRSIVIAIPYYEHKKIKYFSYSHIQNARTLLAEEVRQTRRFTAIPPDVLLKIVDSNKKLYPNSFKK